MAINVKNISYQYQKNQPIFKDVSFNIKLGETICILGPNATGKTTLIKNLAGILNPTSGVINSDQTISYVPQSCQPAYGYSVLDTVIMGRTRFIPTFSTPSQNDYKQALQSIEQVGITHLKDRPVTRLSGGEQQLTMIARTLATQAKVIVLDEPTASLDFSNQYKVLGLLHSLSKQYGYAIIFSSHRPEHPLYIADRSLLMYKHTKPVFGETTKVITSNNLMKLYNMVINVSQDKNTTPHIEGVVPILNIH